MSRKTLAVPVCLLLLSTGWARAEDSSVDELRQKNTELERRIQKLEQRDLEKDVEKYLDDHPASAEGGDKIGTKANRIRISGEVRIREELHDHLYAPADPGGTNSFNFAHMRTRLRFDVDVIENVLLVIELQDIRLLGEEGTTVNDTEGLDLKRGEMIFKQVGGIPLDVEAGRFVMKYGNERLVGALEWFDQGRSYDGIKTGYSPQSWYVDLWAVQIAEFQLTNIDDEKFFGVYGGTKEWTPWIDAELYVLVIDDNERAPVVGDTFFTTIGTRLFGATGNWSYTGEFAWQTGDVRDEDLSAFAFAVTANYVFANVKGKPKIRFEIAYATGDDEPGDGKTEQFQTVLPTNHMHYGYADLVGWENMIDFRVGGTINLNPKIFVTLDYHHFRRESSAGAWVNAGGLVIRPGVPGSSKDLGQEVDLQLIWRPSEPVSFLFGWAIFLPGTFVEETGASPTAQFGYIQGRVKF